MISCLSGCDCDGQYDDVVSADLQRTQQAADGVLAHVVQAHLEGADHHARLHLSSGGQQQGLSAQPQLLVLRLSRAEGLRRLQGVLGLEAVLGTGASHQAQTLRLTSRSTNTRSHPPHDCINRINTVIL